MTVVGIDGCPAGWIAIICKDDEWSFGVFSSIDELVSEFPQADYYLIDMPMGLGDKHITRNLDNSMRNLLKPRHSTVFQAPAREVLKAESYEEANSINRSILGKGLSIQTWNIVPKIKELDYFLRNKNAKELKNRFFESSPELCFAGFNGGKPILTRKSTSQGANQRRSIIFRITGNSYSINLINDILNSYKRYQVRLDDILDAYILCITGCYGALKGFSEILNDNYSEDSYGIPLRTFYFLLNDRKDNNLE